MNLDGFYRWLGFGKARAQRPDTAVKGCGYHNTVAIFAVPFKNRLRILISGKVMVDAVHMIEPFPVAWDSTAEMSVLPPNYPMPEA